MPKKKISYREGDWFCVPLRTSGYGVGIIARSNGKGTVFGYFFGPKRDDINFEEIIISLRPLDAILLLQFGELGLTRGEWPIIDHSPSFNRDDWPLPLFSQTNEPGNKALAIKYNETTLKEEEIKPISVEKAKTMPPDVLSGYGSVEIKLTKLLN